MPVSDHEIVGGKSAINRRDRAFGNPDGDGHDLDSFVGLYAIDEGTLIAALNGCCGNDVGILLDVDQQARIHELIGPQSTILIVKDGLQAEGTGGLIDLVVYGEQGTRCDFRSIVAAQGLYLQG